MRPCLILGVFFTLISGCFAQAATEATCSQDVILLAETHPDTSDFLFNLMHSAASRHDHSDSRLALHTFDSSGIHDHFNLDHRSGHSTLQLAKTALAKQSEGPSNADDLGSHMQAMSGRFTNERERLLIVVAMSESLSGFGSICNAVMELQSRGVSTMVIGSGIHAEAHKCPNMEDHHFVYSLDGTNEGLKSTLDSVTSKLCQEPAQGEAQNEDVSPAKRNLLTWAQCAAGKYSWGTSCYNCAAGKYQPYKGFTYCWSCPYGKTSKAGYSYCYTSVSSSSCPSGKYRYGNACYSCPAGKYNSKSGKSSCSTCPSGRYSNSGATYCFSKTTRQPTTSSKTTKRPTTSACPAGKYRYGSYCKSCPAGKFTSSSGKTYCQSCPSGKYSNSGSSYCYSKTSCPAGRYKYGNTCYNCPSGKYNSKSGKTSCNTCPSGKYSNSGAIYCFTKTTKRPTTVACPAGKYRYGSYCKLCPAGKFTSSSGKSYCQSCPSGKYSNSGSSSCYSKTTKQPTVKPSCPSGRYKYGNSCHNCPTGRYNSKGGKTSCSMCPSGKYNSKSGKSSCTSCPSGKYNSKSGKSSCNTCPSGKYSPPGSSYCFSKTTKSPTNSKATRSPTKGSCSWSSWGAWSKCQVTCVKVIGQYVWKLRYRRCSCSYGCSGSSVQYSKCTNIPPCSTTKMPTSKMTNRPTTRRPTSKATRSPTKATRSPTKATRSPTKATRSPTKATRSPTTRAPSSPFCLWSSWGSWSSCPGTCQVPNKTYYRFRTRKCRCLTGCPGSSIHYEKCTGLKPCPTTKAPSVPMTKKPTPKCAACKGGVSHLRFRSNFRATVTVKIVNAGGDSSDDDTDSSDVGNGVVLFNKAVPGGTAFDLELGCKKNIKNINIYVSGVKYSLHVSCSKPIGIGLRIGGLQIVAGSSCLGGKLCPYTSSTAKPTRKPYTTRSPSTKKPTPRPNCYWSSWGSWGKCPKTCQIDKRLYYRYRYRKCSCTEKCVGNSYYCNFRCIGSSFEGGRCDLPPCTKMPTTAAPSSPYYFTKRPTTRRPTPGYYTRKPTKKYTRHPTPRVFTRFPTPHYFTRKPTQKHTRFPTPHYFTKRPTTKRPTPHYFTKRPTVKMTKRPTTKRPTPYVFTRRPTAKLTKRPTPYVFTKRPTMKLTKRPTTKRPTPYVFTRRPTPLFTRRPTPKVTKRPTTKRPTMGTRRPTPVTRKPTPYTRPPTTKRPTTRRPTTRRPTPRTRSPTKATRPPTRKPSTKRPTRRPRSPTQSPTRAPTEAPTTSPTRKPTKKRVPTIAPTNAPTFHLVPFKPTPCPNDTMTHPPTPQPTMAPTRCPYAKHRVVIWTVKQYETLYVAVDSSIVWGFAAGHHTLNQFPSKSKFDKCDFKGSEQLCSGAVNCPPTRFLVPGTFYFGSAVGTSCKRGQKIRIIVTKCQSARPTRRPTTTKRPTSKRPTRSPTPYCPAGRYKTGKYCHDCPSGKYQPTPKQTHCKTCPFGKYQPSTGKTWCPKCPRQCCAATYMTHCPAVYYKGTYWPRTARRRRAYVRCGAGRTGYKYRKCSEAGQWSQTVKDGCKADPYGNSNRKMVRFGLKIRGLSVSGASARKPVLVSALAKVIGCSTSDIQITVAASNSRRLLESESDLEIAVAQPDQAAATDLSNEVSQSSFAEDLTQALGTEMDDGGSGNTPEVSVSSSSVSPPTTEGAPQAATTDILTSAQDNPSGSSAVTMYILIASIMAGALLVLACCCCKWKPRWMVDDDEKPQRPSLHMRKNSGAPTDDMSGAVSPTGISRLFSRQQQTNASTEFRPWLNTPKGTKKHNRIVSLAPSESPRSDEADSPALPTPTRGGSTTPGRPAALRVPQSPGLYRHHHRRQMSGSRSPTLSPRPRSARLPQSGSFTLQNSPPTSTRSEGGVKRSLSMEWQQLPTIPASRETDETGRDSQATPKGAARHRRGAGGRKRMTREQSHQEMAAAWDSVDLAVVDDGDATGGDIETPRAARAGVSFSFDTAEPRQQQGVGDLYNLMRTVTHFFSDNEEAAARRRRGDDDSDEGSVSYQESVSVESAPNEDEMSSSEDDEPSFSTQSAVLH